MTSPLGILARYTVPDDPAPTMPSLPSTHRATSSAVKLSFWNAVIRHGPTTTLGRPPPPPVTFPQPVDALVPSSPHCIQRAVAASTTIPANATAAAATHIAAVCRAEPPLGGDHDGDEESAGARRWLNDTSKVSNVVQLANPGGTVPLSAFQERSTSVIDGSAASSAGISPEIWLCCSLKLTSRLHLPMSSGILPVSSFPANSSRYRFAHPAAPNAGTSPRSPHSLAANTCSFGACHAAVGSLPPIGLPEMFRMSRARRPPAQSRDGIAPERALLDTSTRTSRALAAPSVAGSVPVSELFHSWRTSRLGSAPSAAGTVPERRLPKRFSVVRDVSSPSVSGMAPARRLSERSSTCRSRSPPSSGGIAPARRFLKRNRDCSFPRPPSSGGTGPDRLAAAMSRYWRLVSTPSSGGTPPPSNALYPISSRSSDASCPSEAGSRPESAFPARWRNLSRRSRPSSGGTLPLKKLPPRLSFSSRRSSPSARGSGPAKQLLNASRTASAPPRLATPSGSVPLRKLRLTSSDSSRRRRSTAGGNSPANAFPLRLSDVSVGASSRAAVGEMVPEMFRPERSIPTMSPVVASHATPGHKHHGGARERVAPDDAADAYVHCRSAPAGSVREDFSDSSVRRGSGADDAAEVMVSRGRRRSRPPCSVNGDEVVPVAAMAEEECLVLVAEEGLGGGGGKMEAGKVAAHWCRS
ncbi:hypothetical protein EJB05_52880, partial [Eragrostis curvula]